MAPRKTDFTGDRFGNWVVVGKAEEVLVRGRPTWSVRHVETGELRPVLQTDLPELRRIGALPACIELHPFAEANEGPDHFAETVAQQIQKPTPFPPTVDLMEALRQGVADARTSGADPTSHALPDATDVAYGARPHAFHEAGGHTEPCGPPELVVVYDEEAVQATQDPLRKSIRTLMSAIQELREGLMRATAELGVLSERADVLIGLADDVMDASFSTPETD